MKEGVGENPLVDGVKDKIDKRISDISSACTELLNFINNLNLNK